MWKKTKKPENPRLKTAQEFLNVEDISDGVLYSVDGYLFGYLSVRAGDTKLMSEGERAQAATAFSASLSGETEPFQLLSVPRTVDTLGMVSRLTELKRQTGEDARLKLIDGEIAALQSMAREGAKEPMIALKCWVKAARGADSALRKRLHDMRSRLTENKVACDIMGDREITYLCKIFADLSTYQNPEYEEDENVPILSGQHRTVQMAPGQDDALLNLLTPVGGLQFNVSKTVIGSVIGRVYGAIRYPAELDYGWAVDLVNATDCVTAITYYPGNVSILGDALSQSIRRSAKDAMDERDARRRKRLERQAADADKLIDEMDAHNAAIGHISIVTMPFTDDEQHLDDVCYGVVSRYARKRMKLKSLGNLQKEGYKELSPYYVPQKEVNDILRHIMPLETLLGGNPMTINTYRDDNGSYFGRTMDGGIISLDLMYRGRDRTNGNIVATGIAGTGKSTALKHILETLYMSGVKVLVIDPEREFRDLCKNLGGAWMDAGGGVAKINPLQIRPVPEDEENEDTDMLYRSNDNAMALHIHTLDVFFKLYLPSLSDIQRALLKQSLVDLYGQFGIAWDSDIHAIPPDSYPLCSDLYQFIEKQAETDPQYMELAALLKDMADGADSFLWNGTTNIDTDTDFLVFDTNRLQNSSDELKRTQYFNLLTMCWQMMSQNRDQPVFLLCDEAHILLDPAIPQTAMYLRNMAKRGRKYEAMLGVVMQSVVDAIHEDIRLYGQAILDNATYKLLFGADGKNLKESADLFQLTQAEQNILSARERGKALCIIGSQHVHVDFDLPKYKLDLMGKGGGR